MKRVAVLILSVMAFSACSSGGGSVVDKVMVDFGMKEKPEGYVEPSDKVYTKLDSVGKTELKRLNQATQNGEIKFQEGSGGLSGTYYKEVKVYENYRPIDAQRQQRVSQGEAGYVGTIEYNYTVYQSARKSTRAEAAAEKASIRSADSGREVFRYRFNAAGEWMGGAGERTRN